jgi:tetratricopeptide (TPR) repeat protein
LGLAYAALGRHREAVEELVRCLEIPPHANDRIPRFELAAAYLRIQRPADAIRELEKILDIDPKDAATWYNLGLARVMAGDVESAKRAWSTALEADPGYELAQQALARVGSSTRD